MANGSREPSDSSSAPIESRHHHSRRQPLPPAAPTTPDFPDANLPRKNPSGSPPSQTAFMTGQSIPREAGIADGSRWSSSTASQTGTFRTPPPSYPGSSATTSSTRGLARSNTDSTQEIPDIVEYAANPVRRRHTERFKRSERMRWIILSFATGFLLGFLLVWALYGPHRK